MIEYCDLLETVTRQRVTGTKQTPRGKLLPAATACQTFRCLIQPHRGSLQYEVEGVLQDVTEAMYCNAMTQKSGGERIDIQYLDTIIRASGQARRVAFVADEGGQGDHFKVYLVGVVSAGRSGDGGSSTVGSNPGSSSPSVQPASAQSVQPASAQAVLADAPLGLAEATLRASGSLSRPQQAEFTFYLDTSSGPQTQTLFAAIGGSGLSTFVNVGPSPATLTASGTDTINDAASVTLEPSDSLTLTDYKEGRFLITMSYKDRPAYTGKYAEQILTATTTLTKPAQNTTYLVDTTAGNVVITLYDATGDDTAIEFVNYKGTNQVLFAYPVSPVQSGASVANIVLSPNDSQPFKEIAPHTWGGF